MDSTYTDELYEILDEFNSRVEEIVEGCGSAETCELIIPKIREKTFEFFEELEQEMEKIGFIEAIV